METSNNKLLDFSPSAGKSLSYGWDNMKKNFLPYFVITIALSIIDSPMGFFDGKDPEAYRAPFSSIGNILSMAYWLLIVPTFTYAGSMLFVQGVRGQKIELKDITKGFENFVNIVLANLLVIGLIGVGIVLLVIPGIIIACRLAFVPELVMDKGLDPIAAVETSWKMTKGHAWKIFKLAITSFLIIILGLLCFIVGVIPAAMWISASFAAMYQSILEEKHDELFGVPIEENIGKEVNDDLPPHED